MNNKPLFYSAISRVLYLFSYPVFLITRRNTGYNSFLVYMILRLEGYNSASAELYVQQAHLESNFFGSALYKRSFNAFGMMLPSVRETTAVGGTDADEGKFAVYESLAHSVLDRILWDKWHESRRSDYNPRSMQKEGLLTRVIQLGYATDPDYYAKVMNTSSFINLNAPKLVLLFYATVAMMLIIVAKGWGKK